MSSNEALISHALLYENLSASAIAAKTGLSQPTVSRALKKMSALKLGGGRSTVFALVESKQSDALFEVNTAGNISTLGELHYQPNERTVLVQASGYRTYESLPFYLYDALPAGFLGAITLKNIVKHDRVLTSKSQDWSTSQIRHYLTHYGEQLAGNMVLGAATAEQVAKLNYKTVLREDYPAIAQQINSLPDSAGSSVVGEQPKFTLFNGQHHLIVKYSPPVRESNHVATRHRDLMVCEHLALESFRAQNHDASESALHIDDRFYFEMKRFDRIGLYGRKGVVSLRSVDAEYTGLSQDWSTIAKALFTEEHISSTDLLSIETAHAFGHYIANTDMHNGNCSFFLDGLKLAGVTPVYDMLPMAFMPVQGELRNPEIEAPRFVNVSEQAKKDALNMALDFWKRVMAHPQISDEFKSVTQSFQQSLARIAR